MLQHFRLWAESSANNNGDLLNIALLCCDSHMGSSRNVIFSSNYIMFWLIIVLAMFIENKYFWKLRM